MNDKSINLETFSSLFDSESLSSDSESPSSRGLTAGSINKSCLKMDPAVKPRDDRKPYLAKPKNIILYSLFIITLSVFVYNYIDIPVAEWGYYYTRDHAYHVVWQYATYIMPFYYILSPWLFFYIGYRIYKNKPIHSWHKIFILMVISMGVTLFLTEQLKFIFGRYWPATWYYDNLSWIHNKAYGFNWFKQNHSFHSFPSGHTAIIFGFTMVLWWLRDDYKTKIFVLINCLAVALGLILMCYHYVSDILIGSLVGVLISYFTVYIAYKLKIFEEIYK